MVKFSLRLHWESLGKNKAANTFPIMQFVPPPPPPAEILHINCFQFLLGVINDP